MTGLDKIPIAISIAEGLDTKTDSKNLIPGKLTTLENGSYSATKSINKRLGYDEIPNLFSTGVSLDDPSLTSFASVPIGLEVFGNELLKLHGQRLFSYAKSTQKWIDKGSLTPAIIKTDSVVRNSSYQTKADSASVNGVTVVAYNDALLSRLNATVYDNSTGMNILTDITLSTSGVHHQVVTFLNYIYVFYLKTNTLYCRRLNTNSPYSFDAEVSVVTNAVKYDVLPYSTHRMLLVYSKISGMSADGMTRSWLDENAAVLGAPYAPVHISNTANSLCVIQGPLETFYIGFYDGSDLKCTIISNRGVTIHAPVAMDTVANVVNITGWATSEGVCFLYDISASDAFNYLIKYCICFADGTSVLTAHEFCRSVGLYSRAFIHTDSDNNRGFYVGVARQSDLQSSFFVLKAPDLDVGLTASVTDDRAIPIAVQKYTLGGGLQLGYLAHVTDLDGVFSWAILEKTRIVSENATIYSPTGVSLTSLDFENQNKALTAQLGNNLLIAGSMLQMYDGQSIVEHGFLLYPESVAPAINGGSSGLDDGDYQYIAHYEWTDGFGQIHRSQPSVAVDFTMSGGPKSVNIVVETLRLTRKRGYASGNEIDRTDVSVVLSRTLKGPGLIFYRVSDVFSPDVNDVTADTITIVDAIADADLASNEILYTIGGVLPNNPAPASTIIQSFQNRIWLGGLEEKNNILYSKECKAGEPVEFTADFNKSIESSDGPETALMKIDDKLIVSKKNHSYYTFGDGPNNTNTLGSFSDFKAITSDFGQNSPRSFSRISNGIIFKTPKGFYALDSSLNSVYIGADVEAFNDLTVTSAVLVSDLNEVRFTTLEGDQLTYNYFQGKWSTATGLKAIGAALFENSHAILKANGRIFQQSAGFRDGMDSYKMKLVTGWLSINGQTSFKRIYEIILLGTYKSKHKIRVSVGYDYSEAWQFWGDYDPDTRFPVQVFGADSPFGSGATFGGPSTAYIIQVKLKRQKCGAMRFMIEELVTTATEGSQESFTISNLGLIVGVKKGNMKVGKNKKLGVT